MSDFNFKRGLSLLVSVSTAVDIDLLELQKKSILTKASVPILPNIFFPGLGDLDFVVEEDVMREGWVMMSTTEHLLLPFLPDPGEGRGLNPFPIESKPRCIPLVACFVNRTCKSTAENGKEREIERRLRLADSKSKFNCDSNCFLLLRRVEGG